MLSTEKRIFIIGTQRSGTTLLRLILNSHSEISIPEEATFLMPLLKKKYLHKKIAGDSLKALLDYIKLNAQFKLWNYDHGDLLPRLADKKQLMLKDLIDEIYYSYCHSKGKKIWGDKTPSFFRKLDILHGLFPEAKFIHIVRDGRDIFDSWRKMDPSKNNASVIALDWSYKLFKIDRSFKKIPEGNRITIRYEDLLDDPEKTVMQICSVIGIGYEDNMLNFYRTSHDYIGDHHSRLIFKPLDRKNKYKWKKNLLPREISILNFLAGHYLKKYSYELKNNKLKLNDLIYMFKALTSGIPARIIQILRIKKTVEKAVKNGTSVDSLPVGKAPKGARDEKKTGGDN